MSSVIRVIDIFAGPGGLSEGFSRYGVSDWTSLLSKSVEELTFSKPKKVTFSVGLSVEMNHFAHLTLELRALARKLEDPSKRELYRRFLRGSLSRDELFKQSGSIGRHAQKEAWCATLGEVDESDLDARIDAALSDGRKRGADDAWVLIGGPPCQAYSLVGRSRNRGIVDYVAEKDKRHFLYKEYLRIVAKHQPPVFVMENVKGLLSATVQGEFIFEQIEDDLRRPEFAVFQTKDGVEYDLHTLTLRDDGVEGGSLDVVPPSSSGFVVRMENHGIPQARHRLILLGVRKGIKGTPQSLVQRAPVTAKKVLDDLPPVRSGLSKETDSSAEWRAAVSEALTAPWFRELSSDVATVVRESIEGLRDFQARRGSPRIVRDKAVGYADEWYRPLGFDLILNHETRSHMRADLHRYLFASSWGIAKGQSPSLSQFPKSLLPAHRNAAEAATGKGNFGDRFRVQVESRPSTTITSHISKDGHYYIHYDPEQCRSLTVREAARLQTFPDDYFFCGPRTEQYHQVGNAVPPLLATQVAGIVADLIG